LFNKQGEKRMARKARKKRATELEDTIQLRGLIEMQLHNAANGEPVGDRVSFNTVVTAGRRWVLSRIYTTDAQTVSYLAIGSGTVAPATGDSALGSETTRLAIGTFTTTGMANNPPSWRKILLRLYAVMHIIKSFLIDFKPEMVRMGELTYCQTLNT
jgi:hypothetical protein